MSLSLLLHEFAATAAAEAEELDTLSALLTLYWRRASTFWFALEYNKSMEAKKSDVNVLCSAACDFKSEDIRARKEVSRRLIMESPSNLTYDLTGSPPVMFFKFNASRFKADARNSTTSSDNAAWLHMSQMDNRKFKVLAVGSRQRGTWRGGSKRLRVICFPVSVTTSAYPGDNPFLPTPINKFSRDRYSC